MTGPDHPHPDHPRPDDEARDGDGTDGEQATSPPDAGGNGEGSETRRGRGGRRHQGSYDEGALARALRGDIEDLRRELQQGLRTARDELRTDFRDRLGELAGHLSELLPKVGDLEDRLAALDHGPVPTATATDEPAAGNEPGAPKDPPPTPAAGWDDMGRAAAEIAWRELARFVDEVLYRQYRLSRLQVPDCWPVHPRMVREIAWLRATYLEARDQETEADSASMTWHIRAVPGFLVNTADAVDLRECRPGVHRLTEPEIDACLPALTAAREAGRPPPAPSPETGPERPRLRPEHYPTRRTGGNRGASVAPTEARAPGVEDLTNNRLLVDACHRDYWLDYYREASAADLAARPG